MGWSEHGMFKMWNVYNMGCSRFVFFWDGRYSGCVMLGIRDFRFEEYLRCRAFGMQDLECWMFAGVWVFGLQNAKKSNYKDEIKKLCS